MEFYRVEYSEFYRVESRMLECVIAFLNHYAGTSRILSILLLFLFTCAALFFLLFFFFIRIIIINFTDLPATSECRFTLLFVIIFTVSWWKKTEIVRHNYIFSANTYSHCSDVTLRVLSVPQTGNVLSNDSYVSIDRYCREVFMNILNVHLGPYHAHCLLRRARNLRTTWNQDKKKKKRTGTKRKRKKREKINEKEKKEVKSEPYHEDTIICS